MQWTLLDGNGEAVGAGASKSERSSHTLLKMRNPREFYATKEGETPVIVNLDKMGLRDIEALRQAIKAVEGNVDTEISFEHPEAEMKPKNEKEVIVDLISVTAFFFPSEAI